MVRSMNGTDPYPRPPSPPPASSPAARKVMRGNRSKNTKPELMLRKALHRTGLRYRLHAVADRAVGCRVDIVFPRTRVAVFVDGCFWHRCPVHASDPVANAEFWQAKFRRNVARDRASDIALAAAGWKVVRVWEHEDMGVAADAIAAVIRERERRGGETSRQDREEREPPLHPERRYANRSMSTKDAAGPDEALSSGRARSAARR